MRCKFCWFCLIQLIKNWEASIFSLTPHKSILEHVLNPIQFRYHALPWCLCLAAYGIWLGCHRPNGCTFPNCRRNRRNWLKAFVTTGNFATVKNSTHKFPSDMIALKYTLPKNSRARKKKKLPLKSLIIGGFCSPCKFREHNMSSQKSDMEISMNTKIYLLISEV